MKNNKNLKKGLIFCGIIIIIFVVSCKKKVDTPKGTPDCITNEITKIMNESKKRNPPAEVWKYEYNNQIVYRVTPYCCDIPGILYDEKCNVICHPDGGITGKGNGKCTDFFQNSTNGELIWKDNR